MDPDGKFPWLIAAAALIGGGLNLYSNWEYVDNAWKGLGFFAVGATVGVAGGFMSVPVGAMQGFAQGATFGFLSGGLVGGFNSMIRGDSFFDGVGVGAANGFIGGGVFGAAGGAWKAISQGRNWFSGEFVNASTAKIAKVINRENNIGVRQSQTQSTTGRYEDLVNEAQKKYPQKADRIEYHHVHPKYLVGHDDGMIVPIDAAYHQMITNEFRIKWGYGKGAAPAWLSEKIMHEVYDKYPIPNNYIIKRTK